MGRIWEDAPGAKPPRDLTDDELEILRRMLEADGRLVLTANEASARAIMNLLLRGAIFPSICAGDDSLVYALTSTGRALCAHLHIAEKSAVGVGGDRSRHHPPRH